MLSKIHSVGFELDLNSYHAYAVFKNLCRYSSDGDYELVR
jgi:hypothetical protein